MTTTDSTARGPLIAADALAAAIDRGDDLLLVDCRHDLTDPSVGPREYAAGHLPGAVFLHVDHDLAAHDGTGLCGGRHPLPAREALRARLEAIGLSDRTLLVAYDSQGGQWAGRLWWLARWLGHERVAVLDGGLPAWTAGGRALETATPSARVGRLTLRTPLVAWIDAATVAADLPARTRIVVDARAPARYAGEQEPVDPVAGHIPGAVNRFWQANLGPDGRFKPAAALRAEFEALLGGRRADAVVHQCGSGVTACHNLLAMACAGLPGSLLYAGSWSEWCADPQRPLATGPTP